MWIETYLRVNEVFWSIDGILASYPPPRIKR